MFGSTFGGDKLILKIRIDFDMFGWYLILKVAFWGLTTKRCWWILEISEMGVF
jgi:hypothetical protein